ncbi:MAG: DUF2281 domain-containing protein [Bacteroidota bacterium]
MSKKEIVLYEIEHIPETFLDEVLDFILFLKTKTTSENMETLITSESSLKKDWLSTEEDAAWQSL